MKQVISFDNGVEPNREMKTGEIHDLKIGDRIKILRSNQKRTLQEIADASELSRSMISKIENNKTVPSVAALVKIAQALGTKISSLLEHDGFLNAIKTTMQTAEENVATTDKGYSIYPYASEYHEKKMQPFLFVAKKDVVKPHELSHEGEEFIFIIRGQMKMKIGEVEYFLKPGDSLYFNSLQKHGIIPVTSDVVYLDIFV
ncbi:MAG: XRE family transcriptional regulator [Chitinophagaceae bacterium]